MTQKLDFQVVVSSQYQLSVQQISKANQILYIINTRLKKTKKKQKTLQHRTRVFMTPQINSMSESPTDQMDQMQFWSPNLKENLKTQTSLGRILRNAPMLAFSLKSMLLKHLLITATL